MKEKLNKKFRNFKDLINTQKNKFHIIGWFFLILQITIILININTKNYESFYWFCNHTPLIFAFAFFLRKKDIIKALINVGFITQFLWTLDFLSKLIFNTYIFDVTRYVFEDINGVYALVPILIHVFSTNLALYFTYKYKPKRKILLYSLGYILLLYTVSIIFTPVESNVNCVYEICGVTYLNFVTYTFFWPLIVFFVMVIPTYAIQNMLYKKFKNKKSKNIN